MSHLNYLYCVGDHKLIQFIYYKNEPYAILIMPTTEHILTKPILTTAYSWWNCQMSSTSANCCQFIPQDRATVFPALGQLAAAELTRHSLKPLRLSYSSRLWISLLLAGDVHPNPGPATQYPCAVGTSNVTSR